MYDATEVLFFLAQRSFDQHFKQNLVPASLLKHLNALSGHAQTGMFS
jgi:hypothetical protein